MFRGTSITLPWGGVVEMLQPDIRIIIIIVIIAAGLPILFLYTKHSFFSTKKEKRKSTHVYSKNIIQHAKMALERDPNNIKVLRMLADAYFDEKQWTLAVQMYGKILEVSRNENNVFSIDILENLGIAAMHAKQYNRAVEVLELAHRIRPDSFSINMNLAKAEYLRKDFSKAIHYFKWVLSAKADDLLTIRLLGLSLVKVGRIEESVSYLKTAFGRNPNDITVQFHLAKVLSEMGQKTKSLELFSGLTKTLQYGPYSLLMLGMERKEAGVPKEAIHYFLKGLDFLNIPQETYLELNYFAAECYAQLAQVKESRKHLQRVMQVNPHYKDVVGKMEIYNNKWFYIYLFGNEREFTDLSYKMIKKITNSSDISIEKKRTINTNEGISEEVVAHVRWPKKPMEQILIRFTRHRTVVQDTIVRTIQTALKDFDYTCAYCVSPNEFTDYARDFARGRAIQLLEKKDLLNVLSKI